MKNARKNTGQCLKKNSKPTGINILDERWQKPRTKQDVLIEKIRDIEEAANLLVGSGYDSEWGIYHVVDGSETNIENEAYARTVVWLLSPAEDGK